MKEVWHHCLIWMKRRWKLLVVLACAGSLLAAYPTFVLGYTWIKVLQADLPGGRNGPLDAYRHTLASAVVSYSLNEGAVQWVSKTMERDHLYSNRMDRHNNRIGASIGQGVKRFGELAPTVAKQVAKGKVMATDVGQTTWLPKQLWRDEKMW